MLGVNGLAVSGMGIKIKPNNTRFHFGSYLGSSHPEHTDFIVDKFALL